MSMFSKRENTKRQSFSVYYVVFMQSVIKYEA